MPSQLQQRLDRYLDPRVARAINNLSGVPIADSYTPTAAQLQNHASAPPAQTTRHWADGQFGQPMAGIQSIMIHGTSGWPSYASADNFEVVYNSTGPYDVWVPAKGGAHPVPAHWKSTRGVGPQYFVDANGSIFPLVGPENLVGDPLFTWHSELMSFIALGIENSDAGDSSSVNPTDARFHRLNTATPLPATDLAGRRLFGLLHPGGAQDLNLIWFVTLDNTANAYTGPGDLGNITRFPGWENTLFTERDYRSLALLCRFLTEQNDIPRNFPLLPYVSSMHDTGNAGIFRKLLLADPTADQIGAHLGVNMTTVRAGGAAWNTAYSSGLWTQFFGLTLGGGRSTPCFRGFISHMIAGHHPCPGPLFDWHRLAREVWDWWWYPFDFERGSTSVPMNVSTTARPYRQARGDTPLIEYFYDAPGGAIEYNNHKVVSTAGDLFTIPQDTPIYALANGVAVAARLPISSDPNSQGFLLVRHEVFHTTSATATSPGRLDYDNPPTYVWTLINFLSTPGFSVNQIGGANPDWLDRFVIRLKETELAVAFHTANPTLTALRNGWAHHPEDTARRPTTGELIQRDADAYRLIANDLVAGRPVLFPLTDNNAATSVTILLGDYLGTAGTIPPNSNGVQVEIFSNVQLNVPGATARAVSAAGSDWWRQATAAARGEPDANANLPANGMVWQYGMTDFLLWINGITWASEWPKYKATDATTHAPIPMPAQPNSRIVT